MGEHPINNLMGTVMENIKGMVDVNTIIGDPVETSSGTIIIPVSKVGFGFAAGGSDFSPRPDQTAFGRQRRRCFNFADWFFGCNCGSD